MRVFWIGLCLMATFHVAVTGSGGNGGTSLGDAKLTIAQGLALLSSGDTLYIHAGTYNEGISSVVSGTSGAYTKILAWSGDTVWLRPSSGSFVVLFSGTQQYIEFDGVNIDGTNTTETFTLRGATANSVHHIRLKNAECIGGPNAGFGATVLGGAYSEFQNLTIHGGAENKIGGRCGPACSNYGWYSGGDYNVVENCDIYDTASQGIQIYNGGGGTPTGNIVRNNLIHDINRSGEPGGDGNGILISGNNNQVYNNLLYGLTFPGGGSGIVVYAGSGNQIYNNTIASNSIRGINLNPGASGTIVQNNIAFNNGGGDFFNSGSGTIGAGNNGRDGGNLFGVDPLFTDAASGDFTLLPGSPALQAGVIVAGVDEDLLGNPRSGTTPTIGPYEGIGTTGSPLLGGPPDVPFNVTLSAPPPNTSAVTALEIESLPATITQDANNGGTTEQLWFVYTANFSGMLSVNFFGDGNVDTDPNAYSPYSEVFEDDASTYYLSGMSINEAPLAFPVVKGDTYYFSFFSYNGDVPVAPFSLSVRAIPNVDAPAGSFFINDDFEGFPMAVVSSVTGETLSFISGVDAGEFGAILNDGTICADRTLHSGVRNFHIYSPQMVLVATITGFPFVGANGQVASNKIDTFYLGTDGDQYLTTTGFTEPLITTVSKTGVLGPKVWHLLGFDYTSGKGLNSLGISNDETIAYFGDGAAANGIHRWDLINDVALSDLAGPIAGVYSSGRNILILADDTILVIYVKPGNVTPTVVKRYNASGTTLNTYSFTVPSNAGAFTNQIAYALDDPASFWIWIHKHNPSGGLIGHFENIRVSDGAVLTSFDSPEFEAGVSTIYPPEASPALFGHSQSCPFLVVRAPIAAPMSASLPPLPTQPDPGSQIDNSVPCCEDTPGGSSTGPVPSPVDRTTFYRSDPGGGVVPLAPDVIDSEDWFDQTPPKAPDVRVNIFADAGTLIETADGLIAARPLRWGPKALSDPGSFVEARIIELSRIERGSSTKDGYYAPARLRLVAQDDDGLIRARLADTVQRNLLFKEASCEILSYAGRKAGLDWIPEINGRIVDIQPALDRRTVIEIQDNVGAQFGTLDPEKTIGLLIGDEHPNKPESSIGKSYPIVLGEVSDEGTTGADGLPAAKGVAPPPVDCGDTLWPGQVPDPEGRLFNPNLASVIDQAIVNLIPGGDITATTFGMVAPIIDGFIGPPSTILVLDPNGNGLGGPADAHTHRHVCLEVAGGAPEYIFWRFSNPKWHPQTNPLGDSNVRYKVVSGTPTNPAFPPRDDPPPTWDIYCDFDSLTDGDLWGLQTTSPPLNLQATVNGTPGSTRYVYAVASLTTLGESKPCAPVIVENGPAILDGTNNITLTWDSPQDNPDSVITYRVLGRLANPPNKYLALLDTGSPWGSSLTSGGGSPGSPSIDLGYTDDGTDVEKLFNVSTTDAPATDNVRAWFAVAQHEATFTVYGSDIAEGQEPKRVKLAVDGGTISTPESADWPHAEPYRIVGGIQQAGFYAWGTVLEHHRQGIVTFGVNVVGPKDASSPPLLINQAYRMLLLFLNEFVEKNNGQGYRSGAFGPIETFADGTPKFWTSKFEAAQDVTKTWLDDDYGYVGSLVVAEPTPLGEILRRFFTDYGGHLTTNHRGQAYVYVLNPDGVGSPPTGRLYKEREDLARLEDHRLAHDETENKITYQFQYDWDGRVFRNLPPAIQDDASIQARGGERIGIIDTGMKDCYFGNDVTTMADRWARHLDLYRYPPRYVTWVTGLSRRPQRNGDPIRFTHRKEGIGLNGETGTPGVLMGTVVSTQPYEIVHTALLFRED